MHILHTESSNGWGGQEIRILREAQRMRDIGHEVILAVTLGGKLIEHARKEGFIVYELNFKKQRAISTFFQLISIMRKHEIDLVNTHSSLDAWIAGFAARFLKKKIIRTRHLSTSIRKGLNSRILYNKLTDFLVTTSSAIIPTICSQSGLSLSSCRCIPTGVDPSLLNVDPKEVEQFRQSIGVKPDEYLVGTVCFVRSWKGINDLMRAAHLLKKEKHIKWIIIGGGYVEDYKETAIRLDLKDSLIFTGHLESPYTAIGALDIFLLLSTGHEGISQASLQAAYLERPLITTPVGGLPEVCIDGQTGLIVPPFSPERVASAVLKLVGDPALRKMLGQNAKQLVREKYMMEQTLDQMEEVYKLVLSSLHGIKK